MNEDMLDLLLQRERTFMEKESCRPIVTILYMADCLYLALYFCIGHPTLTMYLHTMKTSELQLSMVDSNQFHLQ